MLSVDWPNRIVNVPQSYLTFQQGVDYLLDLDQLRLDLRALEATPEGMAWPKTHVHVVPFDIGDTVIARSVKIVNSYKILFEDGKYAVNFFGANTNAHLETVVNQVSVRPNNSAGLVDTEKIDYDRIANSIIPHIWSSRRRILNEPQA